LPTLTKHPDRLAALNLCLDELFPTPRFAFQRCDLIHSDLLSMGNLLNHFFTAWKMEMGDFQLPTNI
jgi:hypothetical protein